jgi:hypothetical protein
LDNFPSEAALFEHRFWLQIMGDHSRFIFYSLAPTESEYILVAQECIILFDRLLEQAHKQLSEVELNELSHKAYDATYRLREFKVELLSMSISSDLKSHLSPSFFNDMLNELEEYLFILNALMNGQNPLLHPLHYHMLWLSDAVGHSATLACELDMVEKDLSRRAGEYENTFRELYFKSLILNGFLRTRLEAFPSLDRLGERARDEIVSFMEFLENIRDQRMDKKVLGTIMPLMADHMAREECYYLWKLSQTTQNIRKPDCDPARPRLKD